MSNPTTICKLVEENSDDEFKQLLSSLPTQTNYIANLYQFDGFWYPAQQLKGLLNCQSYFQALDSDVILVTNLKSGTTWLKALVFALVNRPIFNALTTQNPHDLVPFLESELYVDSDRLPDLSNLPSPRLFSTHMHISALPSTVRDTGCKIVYLCRDPRDQLISLWHFVNKLRDPKKEELSLEYMFETFCKGTNVLGPFWDHALGYWKESVKMPSKVLFLNYEDMKADTSSCLRRLAEYLGCSFSENEDKQGMVDKIIELCTFENLSNLEVNISGEQKHIGVKNKYFFRKGQVGDSVNYLTPEMSLMLDNLIKDKLHAFGFNHF